MGSRSPVDIIYNHRCTRNYFIFTGEKKMKNDEIRNLYMTKVRNALVDEEILQTGSNELCIPWVDDEGREGYITIVFRIPKGSRDGEEYNGYTIAEDYKLKVEEKEAKAKEREEKKAKKIALDKKLREEKT